MRFFVFGKKRKENMVKSVPAARGSRATLNVWLQNLHHRLA
jgi:hypothetical protein